MTNKCNNYNLSKICLVSIAYSKTKIKQKKHTMHSLISDAKSMVMSNSEVHIIIIMSDDIVYANKLNYPNTIRLRV